MFGWVDFREDGKVWWENEKGCCLIRREGEENFLWAKAFSTWAHLKLVSPKWRENSVEGVLWLNDKIAHCTNFVPLSFLFYFFSSTCFHGHLLILRNYLLLLLLLLFSIYENNAYFFFKSFFLLIFCVVRSVTVFFFFFLIRHDFFS